MALRRLLVVDISTMEVIVNATANTTAIEMPVVATFLRNMVAGISNATSSNATSAADFKLCGPFCAETLGMMRLQSNLRYRVSLHSLPRECGNKHAYGLLTAHCTGTAPVWQ
jgi:hypothetical protein